GMLYRDFTATVPNDYFATVRAKDGLFVALSQYGMNARPLPGQSIYMLLFSVSHSLREIKKSVIGSAPSESLARAERSQGNKVADKPTIETAPSLEQRDSERVKDYLKYFNEVIVTSNRHDNEILSQIRIGKLTSDFGGFFTACDKADTYYATQLEQLGSMTLAQPLSTHRRLLEQYVAEGRELASLQKRVVLS